MSYREILLVLHSARVIGALVLLFTITAPMLRLG
jgi:hypothetical protein